MDNTRPTWAEINLAAVKHNLNQIRSSVGATRIMAVVKANAYGHGIVEISQLCQQEKVDFFGVATIEEALLLRESGITVPILVLGSVPVNSIRLLVASDIRATVFSESLAVELSRVAQELARPAYVHIKVDTGMGRLGVIPGDSAWQKVKAIYDLPGIVTEGIFTHFAAADAAQVDYTLQQLESFKAFVDQLEQNGIRIPIHHCANSAAIMKFPQSHMDMVRAGILLYGLYPSEEVKKEAISVIPAMTLKSRVSYIKTVPAGETLSYGRTYCCPQNTRVATVPIGYADGYSRSLSNQVRAVIKGKSVAQIGTICMDQCLFDVSQAEDIQEGDEVILFGGPEQGITADDLAKLSGTINYEIVCGISARVPRTYHEV
ncbi:MAG: alanine racemase [Syntrophomonadaceae bacterium]|nr:alanine racemase [Syntrophomonadaceae bacterium]